MPLFNYTGSKSPFDNAGSFFTSAARTYKTNPIGPGNLGTDNTFQQLSTPVVAPSPKVVAPTVVAPPTKVVAPPVSVTTPVVNRTPINWAKVAGVPNISNESAWNDLQPDATEQTASPTTPVVGQNNDAINNLNSDIKEQIAINNERARDINIEADRAHAMINSGSLSGLITGQAILNSLPSVMNAQTEQSRTALNATIAAQKNLADAQTQGMSGMAALLNAQNEQLTLPQRISLMQAQAAQGNAAALLSTKEAELAPEKLKATRDLNAAELYTKNRAADMELAGKAMTGQDMQSMTDPNASYKKYINMKSLVDNPGGK